MFFASIQADGFDDMISPSFLTGLKADGTHDAPALFDELIGREPLQNVFILGLSFVMWRST